MKKRAGDLRAGVRRHGAALLALGVVVGVGGGVVGMVKVRGVVEKKWAMPGVPPAVVLKNRPVWMNDFLAERIEKVARPGRVGSAFDRQVLVDVRDQLLSDPDVGPWIESIRSVRRVYGQRPGDTVEVDAAFRAPVALVKDASEGYWLVDGAGVKLPERFVADQVPKVVLGLDGKLTIRVIEGVAAAVPDAGSAWKGADLAAGLELLRLLHGKGFADAIVKIDVANFGGRVDPTGAQLVLVTRYNTEVRWGQPVGAGGFEVSVAQKLANLEQIVGAFGRVDANKPWIDVRFDRVLYPKAGAGEGLTSDAR